MRKDVTYSSPEALEAIRARLDGVFDDPQLIRLGPLGDTTDDIRRIVASVPAAPTTTPAQPLVDVVASPPMPFSADPAFAVVLSGGLIDCVVSADPHMIGTKFVIVDYDTDGASEDELLCVPQQNGSICHAAGRFDEITRAGIDIARIASPSDHEHEPDIAVAPTVAPHPFHAALLAAYPSLDLLPFDLTDYSAISKMVAANQTGDTLFNFLWRELSDLDPADRSDALARLSAAMRDIDAVYQALAGS